MTDWVRTVSLYVDEAINPEECDLRVEYLNNTCLRRGDVHIRLPDEGSEYVWEEVGDESD